MINKISSNKTLNVGNANARLKRSAILKNQSGQALVELFAGMLVLIPLFWAIFTLGKFFDFENSGRQAARYVNWEQTVYEGTFFDANSFANNVDGQKTQDRFFKAPLGGFDQNITNQPDANPLWRMPALTRPDGNYYIIDPNAVPQIVRNTENALPLVSAASPASQYNADTIIRRTTLTVPLDVMPWTMSNYPSNDFTPEINNQNQSIQFVSAILPDSFIPDTEADILSHMPTTQKTTPIGLGFNEPVIGIIRVMAAVASWFGILFSTYPFSEILDQQPATDFFDTQPDSAALPASRLQ